MRKKGILINKIIIFLIVISTLTACNSKEEVQQLYVKEQPLQVVFTSPNNYEKAGKQRVLFKVQQGEKAAEAVQFVHVSVWNMKRDVELNMVEAKKETDGDYSLDVDFPQEGLYYVQIHTGNKKEIITPTKRFIIGKLSAAEQALLRSGAKTDTQESGHHH